MKKLSVLALALSVATLGIPVFAYGQPQEMKQDEQKPKLTDIKGTVKVDGDKITFVSDDGEKSWEVVNPESEGPPGTPRRTQRSRVRRQGPDQY